MTDVDYKVGDTVVFHWTESEAEKQLAVLHGNDEHAAHYSAHSDQEATVVAVYENLPFPLGLYFDGDDHEYLAQLFEVSPKNEEEN